MKEKEMKQLAHWMNQVVENIDDEPFLKKTAAEIADFCHDFPPPGLGLEEA
jgi:glycine/serine hydroxymethyltransferase